jgi:hypothetical protein
MIRKTQSQNRSATSGIDLNIEIVKWWYSMTGYEQPDSGVYPIPMITVPNLNFSDYDLSILEFPFFASLQGQTSALVNLVLGYAEEPMSPYGKELKNISNTYAHVPRMTHFSYKVFNY